MSLPECRICLESTGALISVCECKGYSGYVHAECIEKWIHESGRGSCEICQSGFKTTTKHRSSRYCCRQFLNHSISWSIPTDLLTKQFECTVTLSLSQLIMYFLYGYDQYMVVTLINSFVACLLILSTFCTCTYESRFYVQNFALRLIFTAMSIRFLFVILGYMDMATLTNSCVNCGSILSGCRWTCKEELEYSRRVLSQLDSIVYQSIFFVGTFMFVKIAADIIISSKVLKIQANEIASSVAEGEDQPLISEV